MTKSSQKRAANAKNGKKNGYVSRSTPLKRNTNVITTAPRQRAIRDGIIVQHKEYVGPLISSATPTTFSLDKVLRLNPGVSTVFPWLAAIARNYESFRFKKCHLIVQNYMSGMRDGMVNYCVDYDADDPAPGNLVEMLSNKTAGSYSVGQPFIIKLDVPALNKVGKGKFTRRNDSETDDPLLHESGIIYMNASVPTELKTSIVAQIYLDYEIELKTPQLLSSSQVGLDSSNKSLYTFSPTSGTHAINVKNNVVTKLSTAVKDMAMGKVGDYDGSKVSVGELVPDVVGGRGTQLNLSNDLNTITESLIRIADLGIVDPDQVEAPGNAVESWTYTFLQKGYYRIYLLVETQDTVSEVANYIHLIDTCAMTTNASEAFADLTFSLATVVGGVVHYHRAVYEISVEAKVGDYLQVDQTVYRSDSSQTFAPLGRLNSAIHLLDPATYNFERKSRNIFPSALGTVKKLCYHNGGYYGYHREYRDAANGRKFLALDPSIPSLLDKHHFKMDDDYVKPVVFPPSPCRR